ncbi:hypothetical protein [Corynebacterium hindlerae]|uniref:hypothetical protein n=1 Tax=Corynebacterium hindlerae TaxID=699041 RepID=UPI0031B6B7EF
MTKITSPLVRAYFSDEALKSAERLKAHCIFQETGGLVYCASLPDHEIRLDGISLPGCSHCDCLAFATEGQCGHLAYGYAQLFDQRPNLEQYILPEFDYESPSSGIDPKEFLLLRRTSSMYSPQCQNDQTYGELLMERARSCVGLVPKDKIKEEVKLLFEQYFINVAAFDQDIPETEESDLKRFFSEIGLTKTDVRIMYNRAYQAYQEFKTRTEREHHQPEYDYLRCMGFPANLEWVQDMVGMAESTEFQKAPGYNLIELYSDRSDFNYGRAHTTNGDWVELFAAKNCYRYTVAAHHIRPGLAWVDVMEDGELSARMITSLDNPLLLPAIPLESEDEGWKQLDNFQFSGIGVDLKFYTSVQEWEAATPPLGDTGVRLGPTFFTSPWTFELAKDPSAAAECNSVAMITGVIKSAGERLNGLNNGAYLECLVDVGPVMIRLLLPKDTDPAPYPSCIVTGTIMLFGTNGAVKRLC